ncbi:metal-dependent hydrolase [Halostella sp. PRR32]|uniref:metal-dependent hydrolase n=1 Tax=Halostella sp. PRR32 TaxID=3098147 RepID=UPI00110DCC07|nr:metal-dependent hydrolase [Halostella sp. PRR32]
MYQLGHYGIALLVYAPVGAALVVRGNALAAYLGGAIMVGTAMLPDCDHRLPLIQHRGPTHSFVFALLIGVVFGFVGSALDPLFGATAGLDLRAFGFAIGTLTVLTHMLGDVLTPMGIRPFWPLSRRRYSFDVTPAKNPVANYVLFALGVFASIVTLIGLGKAA